MATAQIEYLVEHFNALARSTGAFVVLEHQFDANSISLITSAGSQIRLSVESRARVTPQEIWGLIQRLRTLGESHGLIVLFAPVISPRVAQICRENRLGYLDASGNCHIEATGMVVHVEGRRSQRHEPRHGIDLFARKSSRIIRIMLEDVSKGWLLKSLPHNAAVSPALVTHVSRALIQESYAEFRDRFLFIRDPLRLLEAWAQAYKSPERHMYYVMQSHEVTQGYLEDWARKHSAEFALSGLSGAWVAAPMVKPGMLSCYMAPAPSPVNLVPDTPLRLKQVNSGANLSIWVPGDDFVFHGSRVINGSRIVSPIQLYLDLMKIDGRGEDAAKEILDMEILPKWRV